MKKFLVAIVVTIVAATLFVVACGMLAIKSIDHTIQSESQIQELKLTIVAMEDRERISRKDRDQLLEELRSQKEATKKVNEHWTKAYQESTDRAARWFKLLNEEKKKNEDLRQVYEDKK